MADHRWVRFYGHPETWQTSEGHWKPVLYRTLNRSVPYLPLLVITYLSTPSAFKVASEEVGWRVVTYNTKITILVKGQVASFVEPMYIIHSCKQATTVSVYTLRLIFCFSSLHTTGTKSTTFTAELFVYNPKHYLFAISIGPTMSACQGCIHFGERDITAGQYVTLPEEIPGCKVSFSTPKKAQFP